MNLMRFIRLWWRLRRRIQPIDIVIMALFLLGVFLIGVGWYRSHVGVPDVTVYAPSFAG